MNLNLADFFLCEGTVEGDVLKDVVLLGPVSNNGREYTVSAMQSAIPLYEGRAIYGDHALGKKVRGVMERFGHAEGVRVVEQDAAFDGKPCVRGNVPFLRSHPMAGQVIESYQKKRPYFGFSHVADGRGRQENGKTFVEQIVKVSSLDLVDRAATGSLVEQDAPPDPAAAHTEALTQMVVAIMSDPTMDKAAKKKKLDHLLDMQDDTATPAPDPAAPPPMSEQTIADIVAKAVEANNERFDRLVEQEVQRRAADAKYIKPTTPTPPAVVVTKPTPEKVPTDPAERKKWLHSRA